MPQTSRLTRSQSGYRAENLKGSNKAGRVFYHATPVVEWDARKITLNTDGWKTSTTKNRMNQTARHYGLPFAVFQKKGAWFVSFRGNMVGNPAPVYNREKMEWEGTNLDLWYAETALIPFKGSTVVFNRKTGKVRK